MQITMEKTKLIRHCALTHEGCGVSRVKVLFREGGFKPKPDYVQYAYWMNHETYDALPLGEEHSLSDYEAIGKCDPAYNTDIYSNK